MIWIVQFTQRQVILSQEYRMQSISACHLIQIMLTLFSKSVTSTEIPSISHVLPTFARVKTDAVRSRLSQINASTTWRLKTERQFASGPILSVAPKHAVQTLDTKDALMLVLPQEHVATAINPALSAQKSTACASASLDTFSKTDSAFWSHTAAAAKVDITTGSDKSSQLLKTTASARGKALFARLFHAKIERKELA